jgi:hypothetical protein
MTFWERRRAAKRLKLMKRIAFLDTKGKLCEKAVRESGPLPQYVFDQFVDSAAEAAALRVELNSMESNP